MAKTSQNQDTIQNGPYELAAPAPDELTARAHSLAGLQARAEQHADRRISEQTRRLYAQDWAHFTSWCQLAGLQPCPASVDTIRWYLTDLEATRTETGDYAYSPATLKRRLAGIAAAHREAGVPSPTRDPAVTAVLTGISRVRARPPQQQRPLLLEDVRTILASLPYNTWPEGVSAARDAFILLAGFAGARRREELTTLTTRDITWHPEDGLHVRIRSSKTDQHAQGATIVLPYGHHAGTCPVCAYLRWIGLLSAHEQNRPTLMATVLNTPTWQHWAHICGQHDPAPTNDPDSPPQPHRETPHTAGENEQGVALLRGINRGGYLSSEAITGEALRLMIKRRAAAAGITGRIGFHSLRAGFVTQARRNGAEHRAVRRQTLHGSDAMVELYDRDHTPLAGNAVTQLGL